MADWNFEELWSIWQFQIPQKHVFQLKNLRQVLFSITSFALWCKFSQFCIVCLFCLFYIELYSRVFHCNVSYCPVLSVWYRAYMVKSMVWWVWWVCGGASGGKVSLKVAATDKHGILPGRSSPCHFYLIISEKVKVKVFIYNVSESESCDRQTWNPPGTIIISRKVKIKDKHGLLPSGGNGQIVWSSMSVMMMGLSCPLFDGLGLCGAVCCLLFSLMMGARPPTGWPVAVERDLLRTLLSCRSTSLHSGWREILPPKAETNPPTKGGEILSSKSAACPTCWSVYRVYLVNLLIIDAFRQ